MYLQIYYSQNRILLHIHFPTIVLISIVIFSIFSLTLATHKASPLPLPDPPSVPRLGNPCRRSILSLGEVLHHYQAPPPPPPSPGGGVVVVVSRLDRFRGKCIARRLVRCFCLVKLLSRAKQVPKQSYGISLSLPLPFIFRVCRVRRSDDDYPPANDLSP